MLELRFETCGEAGHYAATGTAEDMYGESIVKGIAVVGTGFMDMDLEKTEYRNSREEGSAGGAHGHGGEGGGEASPSARGGGPTPSKPSCQSTHPIGANANPRPHPATSTAGRMAYRRTT